MGKDNFCYREFWNNRYLNGGNSGAGSYGENSLFKANFINAFIKKHNIKSVLEVGSGDGNNLALYEIENYLGLDISPEAVRMCKEKFKGDKTKKFKLMEYKKEKADLVLALDIFYHIFPREEWEKTIDYCIESGDKVLFYTFINPKDPAPHLNDYKPLEYLDSKVIKYKVYPDVPPNSRSRFVEIIK